MPTCLWPTEDVSKNLLGQGRIPRSKLQCIMSKLAFQNKPNGQYEMEFTREAVLNFVKDLPVRKVPGIGRVGEKVLLAMGAEVSLLL